MQLRLETENVRLQDQIAVINKSLQDARDQHGAYILEIKTNVESQNKLLADKDSNIAKLQTQLTTSAAARDEAVLAVAKQTQYAQDIMDKMKMDSHYAEREQQESKVRPAH